MKMEHMKQTDIDIFDAETGELKDSATIKEVHTFSKTVEEEAFIKVYYRTFLAAIDGNIALAGFLIAVGKRMSYSSNGQIVCLYKPAKKDIAWELGVSLSRVNQYITQAVELGLLLRKERGYYQVSPFLIGKGEWRDVHTLQIDFNEAISTINITTPKHPAVEEQEAMGRKVVDSEYGYLDRGKDRDRRYYQREAIERDRDRQYYQQQQEAMERR